MNLLSTLTFSIFVLATVANAVTSPITEMALREYQANRQHQAVRQKLYKAGRHRPTGTRHMQPGSAMSLLICSNTSKLHEKQHTNGAKWKIFSIKCFRLQMDTKMQSEIGCKHC